MSMIGIFEIEKGVIGASDVSGLMLVNLENCDAVLVPKGSEWLMDCVSPRDISMFSEVEGKVIDILSELTQ